MEKTVTIPDHIAKRADELPGGVNFVFTTDGNAFMRFLDALQYDPKAEEVYIRWSSEWHVLNRTEWAASGFDHQNPVAHRKQKFSQEGTKPGIEAELEQAREEADLLKAKLQIAEEDRAELSLKLQTALDELQSLKLEYEKALDSFRRELDALTQGRASEKTEMDVSLSLSQSLLQSALVALEGKTKVDLASVKEALAEVIKLRERLAKS